MRNTQVTAGGASLAETGSTTVVSKQGHWAKDTRVAAETELLRETQDPGRSSEHLQAQKVRDPHNLDKQVLVIGGPDCQ